MIRVFENLQEYNTFTNNGQNLVSGDLYWVKGEKSAFFLTNNIDGEVKKYDMMDEIPEGYIIPTGNIAINANGEEIDISQYATASVNVPIPEGYIVPSGNKEIIQNGTNIDVHDYATASVNVPIPEGYIVPSGNKEITANGTNIDVAQYATATVAVPQPTGNISITENGENIDIAQYATASVNVAPNLTTQNITENGTYQPSGDYDGFSSVTVNVAGSGGNEDLIDLIEGDIVTLNIPNGTTKIGDYAFNYCKGLTSIDIPNSVTSIGDYAFYYCSGLTSIDIPNSVTSIGDYAFNYCKGLTSINIPNSVTSIGKEAFSNCEKLSNITILSTTPPTVDLGYSTPTYYVFVPSDSVDTYKAADGWKRYPNIIYSLPLLKGEYLTGTIEMPINIDIALSHIFYKYYPRYFDKLYINDIEVSTDYSLKQDTSYTFKFELFDKRLIGGRLFADTNYNFVTSIAIPDSVTSIGKEAFTNCRKLTSVDIPNSVTSIGDYAFQSTGLTDIIIPDSVTSIGYNILDYNNQITNITILATTPPTLKSDTISGSNNCPIYVPVESVDAYKTATNWSSLADRIQAIPAE